MIKNLGKPVIDFTSYITERTINFTGREWVFQAINNWLPDPDGSRFFLLIGEPGSGKTAISARLSQFTEGTVSPPTGLAYLNSNFLSAFHFCSARDIRWISPRIFAESLATQLAKRYQVYAKAIAEKSGDRSIRFEVQQRIEQGQGVGVIINKLDVSGVSPEDAFDRVVRGPLEALVAEELDGQVIILVDALDEALSSALTPNIVSLLSQTDNLPSRVRFILTSRLEIDVLRPLRRSHPKELTLISGEGLTQSLQDVQLYAQFALDRKPELENKLAPDLSRQTLINAIQEKSEGNFLYVRYLLNMLQNQQEQINLSQLNTLPTGLDGIYLEFLERLVKSNIQSWENKYAPILGALAVAQIPLNEAQLSNFTGQTELSMTLKRLHQLLDLDETLPLSQRTYAIYHRSFIDFLLDEDRSEEYGCDEKREHLHLASWCEKGNLSIIWGDVKYSIGEQGRREYARKYYVTHLYLSHEWQQPQKQRLFAALDSIQYGQAKIRDDPSTHSYARDLDLGRQATTWEGWTLEEGIVLLPHLWQYTLLRCSLTSRADQYPEEAFRLLVLLERTQEALGLAELLTDPAKKVRVLQCIAEQLRQQANKGSEWLDPFMRASDVARTIQSISQQAEALRGLGIALIQAQQWEQAEYVIDTIQDSFQQAEALSALGTALAQEQQWKRASEVWKQTERVIDTIQDRSRHAEALSALSTALAQAQQWAEAERVISSITDSNWQARALRALVTALAQAHQWTEAEHVIDMIQGNSRQADVLSALATALAQAQLWTEVERVIDMIQDSYQHARALRELGTALAQAQQWEHASHVWEQAERIIGTIRLGPIHAQALRHLGLALARAQQWTEAERVIDMIQGRSRHAEALSALSTALARAHQWAEAERVIDMIQGRPQHNGALSALSTALAQAQQWAEAERVISSITDSNWQARALRALSTALAQAQQREQASQVWERAKRVIGSIRLGSQYAEALSALSTALARAQQWAEAERIIGLITDSNWKVTALSALGATLAQAQQWDQALQVWAEAERITDSIQDSSRRTESLCTLGTALAQAQQWKQASQIWAEAEQIIGSIQDSSRHAEALSALGIALAQAQQWAEAERIIGTLEFSYQQVKALSALSTALAQAQQWAEAERIIGTLEFSDDQVRALSALGTALAQAQQWEQASQVWERAKRVSDSILYRYEHTGALSALSTALAQAQQWEQAEHVIDMLHGSDEQVEALSALGTALAQTQQWERASQVWAEAEHVSVTLQYSNQQVRALSALGIALAQAQQWAEADRIISSIPDKSEQVRALKELSTVMADADEFKELLHIIQHVWLQVETRAEALTLFSIASTFICRKPEVGIAFFDTFTWVDTFLGG